MKRTSKAARIFLRVAIGVVSCYMLWFFATCGFAPSPTPRARMYTQEVAAIAVVRTIQTAQTQYRSQFDHCAGSLRELGAADLIDARLASGSVQGYNFAMTITSDGYTISATPIEFNRTGSRTFYSDQTMVVHEHYGPEPATARDPESK
jgi:hypothetical protein